MAPNRNRRIIWDCPALRVFSISLSDWQLSEKIRSLRSTLSWLMAWLASSSRFLSSEGMALSWAFKTGTR